LHLHAELEFDTLMISKYSLITNMNPHIWRVLICSLVSVASIIRLDAKEIIEIGANPESITRGFDGKLFITLMGPTRTEGDGNGGIVMFDGQKVTPFCDGMDDPKGIVMLGDFLITADFKKVWKVDSKGNKSVLARAEDFPDPPLYLNDVALAPDGRSVLVTDMGARDKMFDPNMKLWPLESEEAKSLPAAGRVFRITADGKITEEIAPDEKMRGPNGIHASKDGTLRVAEFFSGSILQRESQGWIVVASGHRSADGIQFDSEGRMYVSEVVTGKVTRYETNGKAKTELDLGTISAADIFIDEKTKALMVPDTKAGKLIIFPL
jgi:hypothetical protein